MYKQGVIQFQFINLFIQYSIYLLHITPL